jgi:hypothetical protein
MDNPAKQAAYRIVNAAMEGKAMHGDRYRLDIQRLLFLQAVAIHVADIEAPILPVFQEAYGEDLRALPGGLQEAMTSGPRFNVMPSLPQRGSGEYYATFSDFESAVLITRPDGEMGHYAIPAIFVRYLADYAISYLNGVNFSPIEGVDHIVEGPVEQWQQIRRQANG